MSDALCGHPSARSLDKGRTHGGAPCPQTCPYSYSKRLNRLNPMLNLLGGKARLLELYLAVVVA